MTINNWRSEFLKVCKTCRAFEYRGRNRHRYQCGKYRCAIYEAYDCGKLRPLMEEAKKISE
jgi:hypothetical protein